MSDCREKPAHNRNPLCYQAFLATHTEFVVCVSLYVAI